MRVLLVHGLGRTPLSLQRMGRSLRQAGHAPAYFAYFAFAQSYDEIRRRLAMRLRRWALVPEPVALVGHSLGGLLLRHALAEVPELQVHRLIMVGTPNQPPRRARAAIEWLPFRLLTGSCGELLASPAAYTAIPPPRVPYTLIAGTGGPAWLAGPFGREPHDGFVAVSETLVVDGDRPLLLPVGHTFMTNRRGLHREVIDLLRSTSDAAGPCPGDRGGP